MRIVSWNVNGLRACARKGFLDFLESSDADVVCLQEVRALPEQLDDQVRAPDGWHAVFAPAERKGYSGVAIYSRQPPTRIESVLGVAEYDVEGRYLLYRTDYRSIFWEVLRDHMGAVPAEVELVFPGYTAEGLAAGELGLIDTT